MRLHKVLATVGVIATTALGMGVPHASAATSGTEYFFGIQTTPNGQPTVDAIGPLNAVGHDDQVGNVRDRFVFPDGALRVVHHATTDRQHFDAETCVFSEVTSGTYTISGGTGSYAHAQGSGTFNALAVGHGAPGCKKNKPPSSFVLVIEAHGPLSL